MNMNDATPIPEIPEIPSRHPFNPVFWLMWLLPAAAVIASFATLAIALRDADRALPANYHWEGERLDADFERARRAAQLGITARIEWSAADGTCTAALTPASAGGEALELRLTHGVDAGLDRMLRLVRVDGGPGGNSYRAPCTPLPQGRWRVALQDAAGSWAVRANVEGAPASFELRARAPEGPGP